MNIHIKIVTTLLFLSLLFVGATLVMAQTPSFTEPDTTVDLPIPISTSNAAQAIDSALGLGISADADFPAGNAGESIQGATLFVKGTSLTKASDAGIPANVLVGANDLFLEDSQVQIGGTCANNSRVCVVDNYATDEASLRPALYVSQQTGIGIFGETATAGSAGVYGQGYYGVKALATGDSSITALKAQSCDVTGGTSGFCISYGTAGFFSGDFVVEDNVGGSVSGALSGDGQNLYRVQSLYNLAEGDTPTSHGVAYKSFGMPPATITIAAGATETISDVVTGGEIFLSANVSEGNGSIFYASRFVAVSYDDNAKDLTLTNTSSSEVEVRVIVSYLLP